MSVPPGRINIIGEHTDYNEGFVLPAAIDQSAFVAMLLRNDNEINLFAADLNPDFAVETLITNPTAKSGLNESFSAGIHVLKPVADSSWSNYLTGAATQFIKKDVLKYGVNVSLTGDVPVGAGLRYRG